MKIRSCLLAASLLMCPAALSKAWAETASRSGNQSTAQTSGTKKNGSKTAGGKAADAGSKKSKEDADSAKSKASAKNSAKTGARATDSKELAANKKAKGSSSSSDKKSPDKESAANSKNALKGGKSGKNVPDKSVVSTTDRKKKSTGTENAPASKKGRNQDPEVARTSGAKTKTGSAPDSKPGKGNSAVGTSGKPGAKGGSLAQNTFKLRFFGMPTGLPASLVPSASLAGISTTRQRSAASSGISPVPSAPANSPPPHLDVAAVKAAMEATARKQSAFHPAVVAVPEKALVANAGQGSAPHPSPGKEEPVAFVIKSRPETSAPPADDSAGFGDYLFSRTIGASMVMPDASHPAGAAAHKSKKPFPPRVEEEARGLTENAPPAPAYPPLASPPSLSPSPATTAGSKSKSLTKDASSSTSASVKSADKPAAPLPAEPAAATSSQTAGSGLPKEKGRDGGKEKAESSPLDLTLEEKPALSLDADPPAPVAPVASADSPHATATGDDDALSEKERAFVRSLAKAAGKVAASDRVPENVRSAVRSVPSALSGVVKESTGGKTARPMPESVPVSLSVPVTTSTVPMAAAGEDKKPQRADATGSSGGLSNEVKNDLMPATPEKMPEQLPAFNGPATGKVDIQSTGKTDFDQANNKVIFTGKVELNCKTIRLRGDRVEVYMKKGGGGMERVEASGNVLMRTQATETGPGQMASAGHASYNLGTGEITLTEWPKIQEEGKSHVSTSPATKMFLKADGRLITDGPNRTLIGS